MPKNGEFERRIFISMKIKSVASVPLIVHDPFLSIWSPSDKLYDSDTMHWCRAAQKLNGYITIDGTVYCFMGKKEFHPEITQKSMDITATATTYVFARVIFTGSLLTAERITQRATGFSGVQPLHRRERKD